MWPRMEPGELTVRKSKTSCCMDLRGPGSPSQALAECYVWLRGQGRLVTTFEMINQGQGLFYPRGKLSHLFSTLQHIELGSFSFVRWSLEHPKHMGAGRNELAPARSGFLYTRAPTCWLSALVHLAESLIPQSLTSYDVSFMASR